MKIGKVNKCLKLKWVQLICALLIPFSLSGCGGEYAKLILEFDGSRKGAVAEGEFYANQYNIYFFSLHFNPDRSNKDEIDRVIKVMNSGYELFLADTVHSKNPVRVTRDYFEKNYVNSYEYGLALTNAIHANGTYGKFTAIPKNTEGHFPIEFELSRINKNGEKIIIERSTFLTCDVCFWGAPNGAFHRNIFGRKFNFADFGLYKVKVTAIKDTPALYNVPINFFVYTQRF